MIRREQDTALIDRIAAMADVRPFIVYHDQPVDWWPAIRGCAVLSNGEDAIAIFEQTADRVWQSHTLFAPSCRGKRAVETGRQMVAFMLPKWADVLWGATPLSNAKARWFNRQIGANVVGRDTYDAEGDVELFEIRKPI